MVDKAVAKEKENNLTSASPATGAMANGPTHKKNNKKKPITITNITPTVVPPPTNGAAAAALAADQQRKTAAAANWNKVTNATKMAGVIAKNQRAAAGQKLFSRKLVSAMSWEFFSPPPLNSVSGKIVPRVLNRYKHRRLLSIEVHQVTPHIDDSSDDKKKGTTVATHSYEECIVR